ncbi:hypothetical protein NG800_015630 [Epilithonimonas ginsengisoli]|uniref:DUF4852 domain-containing protein n=1 Tax=Epilithonimonas ginsengisoli TaxID=1245592 RepID=A0ABU4JL11_9FLAO|nr:MULTISPECIES: hypothetical protein [Chryseobacterium group]MBV6881389.1 hypothetical protein [Epilithonimonas sp. FP105]MDW8550357.1 hypothetical protein [Epilithonimonas ginsengisoli]
MKKLIIFSTILLSSFMIAQNKIANIYSTSELRNKHNSVPANEEQQFYVQYLKASLFENIKNNFNYKQYPSELLRKFTDSVVSHNDFGFDEQISNNQEEKVMTFEEYASLEKERENKQKQSLEKMKKEDPKQYKLMTSVLDGVSDKTGDVKKDYEQYKENYEYHKNPLNDPYSLESRKLIIKKLDEQFAKKNYDSEETKELLLKNFSPNYIYFPHPVSKHDSEAQVYEVIENEILAFGVTSGYAAGTYENYYKIDGESIIPISVYPYEDQNFDKKVSKYVKKGFRFEERAGADIKKIGDDYFLSTNLYNEDDANCCPSLLIEYKTKDFKTFIPLKIADNSENPKWKTVK